MKIAVITGASSGIGREFVYSIDKRDSYDEIWVIARRADRLEELKAGCKNKIRPLSLDLSLKEDIEKYAELLRDENADISILVNAAGCGVFGPFEEKDLGAQLGSAQLNSLALTAMCHVSLPFMKSGSSIINMGSNSSWQPVPNMAIYGASKAYVLSFSRALGRELRRRGIQVLCVCPGWIKTEFQAKAKHDEYVKYTDKWYTPDQVSEQAMKDLAKGKTVSILGLGVRLQVFLVKHLPTDLIMNIWCKQQGIE